LAAAQQFQGITTDSPLFGQPSIGNASLIVKTVTGTIEDNVVKLRLQDDIYHNELIETFDDSATELAFLDETTINLGPNSSIVLDEFVYDPDPSNSSFVLSVTQGALRFTSGVLPDDSYKINTPVATIGIRGTIVEVMVDEKLRDDGSLATRVNLTVVDGEADIIGCDGTHTYVPSGQSASVLSSYPHCSEVRYN
jgi:hypothetical protein